MHILSFLLLLAASQSTIMPFGNSVTAGEVFSSYRPILAQKLRAAGLNVNFVGSQAGDLKQEGYPGEPVEYLAENIRRRYSANLADIVLRHAAQSQFAEEKPEPGIIRSTKGIIVDVRAINPHMIVFVAEVIPAKTPKIFLFSRTECRTGEAGAAAEQAGSAGDCGGSERWVRLAHRSPR